MRCVLIAWAIGLLLPRVCDADAITIEVLTSTYTTSVYAEHVTFVPGADTIRDVTSRESASLLPHEDTLIRADNGWLEANALAQDTELSVFTSAFGFADTAVAAAAIMMDFSPLTDGVASIGIDGLGFYEAFNSTGFVRLMDVTAEQSLFDYSWTCCNFRMQGGNMPWVYNPLNYPLNYTASVLQGLNLFSDHVYSLTMYAETGSNAHDSERLDLRVSGLKTVPEPSTLLLIAIGASGLWARHRRR